MIIAKSFPLLVFLVVASESSLHHRSLIGQRIDETLLDADKLHDDYESQTTSGYQKNNKQDLVSAQDEGAYKDAENLRKLHESSSEAKGGSNALTSDSRGQNMHKDQRHRKNGKKSGFRNSYHKDESGSNSSYYEDYNDDGANQEYIKSQNQKGRNDDRRYYDHHQNGGHKLRDNRRDGVYGVRGEFDTAHGRVGQYDSGKKYADRYLDNKQHRQKVLEYYPVHRHHQGRFEQPQGMDYEEYEGPNTITIYEDPREMYGGGGESYPSPRRAPQLEFRRSLKYPENSEYPRYDQMRGGRYRY